jgi:hypothetical protein
VKQDAWTQEEVALVSIAELVKVMAMKGREESSLMSQKKQVVLGGAFLSTEEMLEGDVAAPLRKCQGLVLKLTAMHNIHGELIFQSGVISKRA